MLVRKRQADPHRFDQRRRVGQGHLGGGEEFLHGHRGGADVQFAENNAVLNGARNGISRSFTGSEFAGAGFSPDADLIETPIVACSAGSR
jgi:hypothetical protein